MRDFNNWRNIQILDIIWDDARALTRLMIKKRASAYLCMMADILATMTTVNVWLRNDTKYLEDFEWPHKAESMLEGTSTVLAYLKALSGLSLNSCQQHDRRVCLYCPSTMMITIRYFSQKAQQLDAASLL
jgi:hypothetical protein